MNELLTLSAHDLAARIRDGKHSALEVVEAHIARIEEVEPAVHAVAVERFAEARKEARAADAAVAAGGELPPLLGVPFTVQEGIAVAGMPWTAGRIKRKGEVADSDAPAVARLREAGAVLMALTNVGENQLSIETESALYGRTDNPYDARCVSGLGAGGEGALVGSGASPFGLAADISGGARVPALFSGVYGHKPTAGLVPVTGVHPRPGGEGDRYLAVGPIARRADDLLGVLRIIAGPDGQDPTCRPGALGEDLELDPVGLNVVDIPDDQRHEIRDDVRVCQQVCVNLLVEHGGNFRPTRFPELEHAFEIWSAFIDEASGLGLRGMLSDKQRRREGLSLAGRLASSDLPTFVAAARERLGTLSGRKHQDLLQAGEALRAALMDALGDKGVAFLPSMNTPAPRHGSTRLKPLGWSMAAIFNVLGFPVTQIPVGFDPTGLPLGTQVISTPGQDHLTVAVARYLESRARNWRIS